MEENNSLVTYVVPNAVLTENKEDYDLQIGENFSVQLIRDVDFGKIPNTKQPTLFKAGAEKVLRGYGLYYNVELIDTYKDHESGYFYYECKATAYNQEGRCVRVGFGCANTREKGTGFASGFDTANSAIKKARKRAIVDLALTLGSLSGAFTQDMESDDIKNAADKVLSDNDPITSKQITRIFAITTKKGITKEKAKAFIASLGYASTKDITQKDYGNVIKAIEEYKED